MGSVATTHAVLAEIVERLVEALRFLLGLSVC